MRTALLQITAWDRPCDNLPVTLEMVQVAAAAGAGFVLTPEVTNCASISRSQQRAVLQTEDQD